MTIETMPIPQSTFTDSQKNNVIDSGPNPLLNGYLEHIEKYFPLTSEYKEFLGKLVKKYDVNDWMPSSVDACGTRGLRYECEDHEEEFTYQPHGCQNIEFCPRCGDGYSKLMARTMFKIFMDIEDKKPGLAIIKIVFTIPEECWYDVCYDNANKLFHTVNKSLREYLGGLMLGMHMSYHEGSPEDPQHPHKPHIEVLILNLTVEEQYISQVDLENNVVERGKCRFRRFNPYIDVDKLRDIYQKQLGKTFGWNVEKVVLHTQYSQLDNGEESDRKLMHMCKYSVRSFAKDVYDRLKEWGVEGGCVSYECKNGLETIPIDKFMGVVDLLMYPKSFHRNRWYGWLSNSVRREYFEKLGIEWESVPDIRKKIKQGYTPRCRICDKPMINKPEGIYFDLFEEGYYKGGVGEYPRLIFNRVESGLDVYSEGYQKMDGDANE